jgi:hypothetical protein
MLAAHEGPTGSWRMVDSMGVEYGRIALRRVGDAEVRYRCEFGGELIGWATSLRLACERIHHAFLSSHGPVPFAGYPVLDRHAR